jgi:hypothetical protein
MSVSTSIAHRSITHIPRGPTRVPPSGDANSRQVAQKYAYSTTNKSSSYARKWDVRSTVHTQLGYSKRYPNKRSPRAPETATVSELSPEISDFKAVWPSFRFRLISYHRSSIINNNHSITLENAGTVRRFPLSSS